MQWSETPAISNVDAPPCQSHSSRRDASPVARGRCCAANQVTRCSIGKQGLKNSRRPLYTQCRNPTDRIGINGNLSVARAAAATGNYLYPELGDSTDRGDVCGLVACGTVPDRRIIGIQ